MVALNLSTAVLKRAPKALHSSHVTGTNLCKPPAAETEGEASAFQYSHLPSPRVQVSFERGEIVQGRVIQFEPSGALIDIGAKATAYMPSREVNNVSLP